MSAGSSGSTAEPRYLQSPTWAAASDMALATADVHPGDGVSLQLRSVSGKIPQPGHRDPESTPDLVLMLPIPDLNQQVDLVNVQILHPG